MKYIKVTNKVGNVNRLGLEKLGLSTKRENSETIGQFGSGIKFAPIAAIRKGMEWYFTGNDNKGKYVLEYIIQEDDGIPSIFYKYDDYVKPSSFTADAGIFSWNDDFQIYREVVANAMDESKISGNDWSIELVDCEKIESVEGEFSVYFTATDSMMDVYKNHNVYFCDKRIPVFSMHNCKLYEPIDDSFRVYCKGVLVYSHAKSVEDSEMPVLSGIFDYEFDDIELNEERTVKSFWDLGYQIVLSWVKLDDEELIKKILELILDKYSASDLYEIDSISSHVFSLHLGSNHHWIDTFEKIYKNHVILKSDQFSFNVRKTIESKGYSALPVYNEDAYTFLNARDLPSVEKILGESFKYDYTMDIHNFSKLVEAVRIVEDVIDNINFDFILGVYKEDNEDSNDTLGITVPMVDDEGERYKLILINKNHALESSVQSLISTLVHEWDHFSSSIGDGNLEGRMFRSLADDRMSNLIYDLYMMKKGNV